MPGEASLVIGAALAATTGRLTLTGVIIAATLGAILGAAGGYRIGASLSDERLHRWAARFGFGPERLRRAQEIFRAHGSPHGDPWPLRDLAPHAGGDPRRREPDALRRVHALQLDRRGDLGGVLRHDRICVREQPPPIGTFCSGGRVSSHSWPQCSSRRSSISGGANARARRRDRHQHDPPSKCRPRRGGPGRLRPRRARCAGGDRGRQQRLRELPLPTERGGVPPGRVARERDVARVLRRDGGLCRVHGDEPARERRPVFRAAAPTLGEPRARRRARRGSPSATRPSRRTSRERNSWRCRTASSRSTFDSRPSPPPGACATCGTPCARAPSWRRRRRTWTGKPGARAGATPTACLQCSRATRSRRRARNALSAPRWTRGSPR